MYLMEHAKDIAEVTALLCAGLFFGYKAFTGYLRLNLSLSIQCQRQKAIVGDDDDLVVCLHLQKGPNGSATLHDAQVRVIYGGTERVRTFPSIERSEMQPHEQSAERRIIDWCKVSAKSPLLKLVPGEETQMSVNFTVPVGAVCLVEVAILGQRTNGCTIGQWKASSVSLPKRSAHVKR